MKKKYKFLLFLLLGFILISPSLLGLIKEGFPFTDDGSWMVIRFSAFYEALRDGQFPVRFLPRLNNGFGYPVADFLYPLFMYLGAPIHALGLSFQDTIKALFGLGLVSSFFFSFFWFRKIFSDLSSMVGSVIYVLFPYHLWDVYKRGSLGEVVSLAVAPFLLWQLERKSLVLSSIGVSLLILSHNSLALFFIPLLVIYEYIRRRDLKRIISIFSLGFGLSSFFWIPALFDKQYVVFDSTEIARYSEFFMQGYGVLVPSVIAFIVLLVFIVGIRKSDITSRYFFLVSILSIVLTLPVTSLIWNINAFSSLIQFPFRFLAVTLVSISFLAAYTIEKAKKTKKVLATIYIVVTLASAMSFITPIGYQMVPDTFYSTNLDTTTVQNEYMPKWVKDKPSYTSEKVEIADGQVDISNVTKRPNSLELIANSSSGGKLKINTVYFPGWKAIINGTEQKIDYEEDGLIYIDVPKGESNLKVFFGETRHRLFADFISVLSLLIIIYLIARGFKIKK